MTKIDATSHGALLKAIDHAHDASTELYRTKQALGWLVRYIGSDDCECMQCPAFNGCVNIGPHTASCHQRIVTIVFERSTDNARPL